MDDLRILVEDHLSRLAYQIMGPVVSIPNIHGRHNFMKSANQDILHSEKRLRYAGPQGNGYYYRPVFEGTTDQLMSQAYIAFHDIDLVDIEEQIFEPVQVDQGEVRVIELLKYSNGNAGLVRMKADTSEAKDTSEEHDFSVTAETEFETQITRSAEATVGVVSGKSEFMARFKSRLEASTAHAWKKSDRIENMIEKEYKILPFSVREITIKEGTPSIRQKIPTKGILDCKVEIGIYNAGEWWFDHLDDVVRCWSGLRAGHEPFSSWFSTGHAVPQSEIDQWELPKLNLDIEVRGERVRYHDYQDIGRPFPGKEAEYEEARLAYLESIKSGSA